MPICREALPRAPIQRMSCHPCFWKRNVLFLKNPNNGSLIPALTHIHMLALSLPSILLPMGKESIPQPPQITAPSWEGASPALAEKLSCHQDTAQAPQALWSNKPRKGWDMEQTVAVQQPLPSTVTCGEPDSAAQLGKRVPAPEASPGQWASRAGAVPVVPLQLAAPAHSWLQEQGLMLPLPAPKCQMSPGQIYFQTLTQSQHWICNHRLQF